MSLAHHRIFVAQRYSIGARKSEGLRFDSSWGLRIFFLSPTLATKQRTSSFLFLFHFQTLFHATSIKDFSGIITLNNKF